MQLADLAHFIVNAEILSLPAELFWSTLKLLF